MRPVEIVALAGFVAALVLQQVFTVPGLTRVAIGLNDSAHGTWFALVLLALLVVVSRRWRLGVRAELALGAAAALVLAPGTELVQELTGRDAEVDDALFDLVGAVGALAVWAAYRKRLSVRVAATITVMAFVVSLYPIFSALRIDHYRDSLAPKLIDFESPRYRWFVESTSNLVQVPAPDAWQQERGRTVLRIDLDADRYPGMLLHEPIVDWTPYRALVIAAFVPDAQPMPFGVSVRFWTNRARNAYWPYELTPGANTLRVPLDARFDPSRGVSTLVLYSSASASGRSLYLGEIHLE